VLQKPGACQPDAQANQYGSQRQALGMPASGRLFLGVNDNERGDNSGAFTVIVAKQ